VALFFRVSLAYLLVSAFGWGYSACWITYVPSWALSLLAAVLYYASGRWKNKAVARRKEEGET